VLAVKINGAGDQTANVIWKYRKSLPETPRPLPVDGLVYMVRDGGIFTALDAATGAVAKQGRLRNAIDQYFASPVYGDGKVYVASAAGTLTVLKAGREWEILSTSEFEEGLWATPLVAGPDLFVRAGETLYCFRGGAGQTVSRAGARPDLAQFARVAGKYRLRPGNELTVAVEDGMVVVTWFRTVFELAPLGGLEFRTKQAVPGKVRFVEEDGAVKRVEMETQGQKMVAERVE
jgi:PQQ-like domain